MFDNMKKRKQRMDDTLEGIKNTVDISTRVTEAKNKTMAWITQNPEKVVMIFLGSTLALLLGSELRKNKTEVHVTINMDPVRTKK